MGALSTYAANGLQNLTLRGTTFASPASAYLGWFTTPPNADGDGTEVTGGGYVRKAVTFTPSASGEVESDGAVTWATFHTAADQSLSGWGLFDASTAGNLLAFGRTPSTIIRLGTSLVVPDAGLTVASNDTHMSDYLADAWLDHLLSNTAYTAPASVAVGVYEATPTASTAGTQVSTFQTVTFAAAALRASVVDAAAAWSPLDGSNPHTLTGFAVADDTDQVLWFGDWPTPVTIPAADALTLNAGWLTVQAN